MYVLSVTSACRSPGGQEKLVWVVADSCNEPGWRVMPPVHVVLAHQQKWDYQVMVVKNVGLRLSPAHDPESGLRIARFVNPSLLAQLPDFKSAICPKKNSQVCQTCCDPTCLVLLHCLLVLIWEDANNCAVCGVLL